MKDSRAVFNIIKRSNTVKDEYMVGGVYLVVIGPNTRSVSLTYFCRYSFIVPEIFST
jgi:hypothetical protein